MQWDTASGELVALACAALVFEPEPPPQAASATVQPVAATNHTARRFAIAAVIGKSE
jgi:hypothetical protein